MYFPFEIPYWRFTAWCPWGPQLLRPLPRLPGDADPDGGALAPHHFLAGEGESFSAWSFSLRNCSESTPAKQEGMERSSAGLSDQPAAQKEHQAKNSLSLIASGQLPQDASLPLASWRAEHYSVLRVLCWVSLPDGDPWSCAGVALVADLHSDPTSRLPPPLSPVSWAQLQCGHGLPWRTGPTCCHALSLRLQRPAWGAAGKSLCVCWAGGLSLDMQLFQLLRSLWKTHSRDILSVWSRDLAWTTNQKPEQTAPVCSTSNQIQIYFFLISLRTKPEFWGLVRFVFPPKKV